MDALSMSVSVWFDYHCMALNARLVSNKHRVSSNEVDKCKTKFKRTPCSHYVNFAAASLKKQLPPQSTGWIQVCTAFHKVTRVCVEEEIVMTRHAANEK